MCIGPEDLGNLAEMFARGEFAPLLEWLRKNIHARGSLYRPRDLVRAVTGKDLDARYLLAYLEEKFLG